MAWHTVQEAQKLTGKSRRTLYRDMASGHVSWASDGVSGRRLETCELIRAYGELKLVTQTTNEELARHDTQNGTSDSALILAELKSLRAEVAELRSAMRLIEYRPEVSHHDTPLAVPNEASLPWWKRPLFKNK